MTLQLGYMIQPFQQIRRYKMKIGDLVQHRLSPVVGVITKIHIDWDGDWAEVTWADGRDSMEKIDRLEAVCK